MFRKCHKLLMSLLFFSSYCSAVTITFSIADNQDSQSNDIRAISLQKLLNDNGFFFTLWNAEKPETLLLNQSLNHDNYTITSVQTNNSVQIVNIHLLNMLLYMDMSLDGEEITNISIYALSNLNPEAMNFILSFGFHVSAHNLTITAQQQILGMSQHAQVINPFMGLPHYNQAFNRGSGRPYPRGVSNPYGNCRNRVCANPVFGAYPP